MGDGRGETADGLAGADTLFGNDGADVLVGGDGVDTLVGVDGNDIYILEQDASDAIVELDGGGSDTIQTERASFSLEAYGEIENLTFSASAPALGIGNGGDNIINASSGAATLHGRGGADVLIASSYADQLFGEDGSDFLQSGGGTNILEGGAGADLMIGGAGNDTFVFSSGDVVAGEIIRGGDGDDDTLPGEINTLLVSGSVDFRLAIIRDISALTYAGAGLATFRGAGADLFTDFSITGSNGVNRLLLDAVTASTSFAGLQFSNWSSADTVTINVLAFGGVDVTGTGQADLMQVTGTSATLRGGGGGDTLVGGIGGDVLYGNDGADLLDGKSGADAMAGGAGNDIYVVNSTGDSVTESAGAGVDAVRAYFSYTLGLNVENLTLIGTSASTLTGNAQANTIIGNSQANTINGALGNDILTGGAGADNFVFRNTPSAVNRDVITDFAAADTLLLDNAIFTALGAAGALSANHFRVGASALDGDDHIIYNPITGALFYDANGSAAGGSVQIATLSTQPTLTASDIGVI